MAKKQAPNTPAKKEVPPAPATDLSKTVAGGQDGLPTSRSSAADKDAIPGADVAPSATPATPDQVQEHADAGETQNLSIPSGKNGPDPVIGLRITAKREGFRRAGHAWSKKATDVALGDLSDDQVKLLMEEHGHMLTVEEVVLP